MEYKNQLWQEMPSAEDQSVNFIANYDSGGKLECRYVRRIQEYFICYLSSHRGCRHGCRFCHLTATKQTNFVPASLDDYLNQAAVVLEYYDKKAASQSRAYRVNFNWMSRGEALSNPTVTGASAELLEGLTDLASSKNLETEFNFSTILPRGTESLSAIFGEAPVNIYYSLYSMQPEFRRKWLPNATGAEKGLDILAQWQQESGREVVLHWAFIKGENDSEESVRQCLDAITARRIIFRFNLVRYNPYSASQGVESSDNVLQQRFAQIAASGASPESKIIQRVGFDVKASCGMFVEN